MQSLVGKKALILGGSGFIGTNLALRLAGLGAIVSRFGRDDKFPDGLENTRWIKGEFSDSLAIEKAVADQDFVFHCISETVPGNSNDNILADLVSNVQNTLKLLSLCRDKAAKKLVFLSSGGTVYGNSGMQSATELSPTNPLSAYGVSKLTIEKYLGLYNHLYGLDYRVVRVSNPFGRFQRAYRQQGLIAAILERVHRGLPVEIWGDGSIVRDYIPVDDLIDGILAVSGYEGEHRIFNVGSGIGRSANDVIASLERVLGREIKQTHTAARAADVPYNVLDISLIESELGWRPTRSWFDALADTAQWSFEQLSKQR